jgi:hypothetical protein
MSTPKSQAEIDFENNSNEDMTGTALPWRAYPEPFRETYELCDGNDVTIACNMQRAVAEAVAAIVNQRIRLRGGEQVRASR